MEKKTWQNTIEAISDGIWVLDMDGQILQTNGRFEQMLGINDGESSGHFCYKVAHCRSDFIENCAFQRMKKAGKREYLELQDKERERWFQITVDPIFDDSGKINKAVHIVRDITEHKKIESQLFRAQRMESIGTLAGGIAHDLNNVLTPIIMSVSLLKEKYLDKQDQRFIDMIERNAKRGIDLVKQVLLFAKGSSGERTIIIPADLISGIVKIISEIFPRSIEILTHLPKDLWPINGDPTQMQQVLMNLCVNARDAMPNGGILTMSVENLLINEEFARLHLGGKAGRYLLFSVSDTGHGIPPEIIDKIFDPFFTTKETGKGTGLGLSSAISIVKGHGGFINAYSEIEKGTEFKVYIPAAKTSETPEQADEETIFPVGNGEMVLVVDDEVQILEITKAILERNGYRVITANNGAEAISAYLQYRGEIKVVISDMMMPVMDGEAAIKDLHKLDPHLKIIAVSGLTDNGKAMKVKGIAHAFLRKPYPADKLLQTLHNILSI